MAGLNSLLSDTQQTQTTLPSWYDTAQQNIASQGATALSQAPTMAQTTSQQAINTLSGTQNPFTQAQNTLQQISSGAANPWITDASGNVTPNTSTALGGLFQAENQQLNQLLPTTVAPTEAANIGSGNFGSLRGQTAVDTTKANALANLNAQQLQAALTNQQTGTTAAAQLGNVGSQGITSEMNVGTAQQNAPFQNIGNLASLIGTLSAPQTVTSQTQLSPLSQATTLANALSGSGTSGALGSLLFGSAATGTPGSAGYKAATSGLLGTGGISSLLSGSGTPTAPGNTSGVAAGSYPLTTGGSLTINPDGTQYTTDASGNVQYYDAMGNPVSNPSSNYGPTPSGGNIDTGGTSTTTTTPIDTTSTTSTTDTSNLDNLASGYTSSDGTSEGS